MSALNTAAESSSIATLNILIVVPSKVVEKFLLHHLKGVGHVSSACCTNVQSAMDAMHNTKPDLVISSMYFEDGDSIDLITRMRNNEALEHIMFMLISGEERFEMLDPIRQAGVIAVLPKPFRQAEILHALDLSHNMLRKNDLLQSDKPVDELKILVVDDSRLARKHMKRVLKKVGVADEQITEAEDGNEAVGYLDNNSYDLVLTDYNMPQMDGQQLLEYIRDHDNLKEMPVIMVTSEENETKLGSIKSSGVTAMLDKPFDAPHLKEIIEGHA